MEHQLDHMFELFIWKGMDIFFAAKSVLTVMRIVQNNCTVARCHDHGCCDSCDSKIRAKVRSSDLICDRLQQKHPGKYLQ